MSWASAEDIYLSTSLASYLDKKLLVLLRDGRKLLGTLRSFDRFANAVLEGACERLIVGEIYCDIPLGLYIIRGENVVLIGELVCITLSLSFSFSLSHTHAIFFKMIFFLLSIPARAYLLIDFVLIDKDVDKEELPPHMTRVPEAEIRRV
ncbi:U6 snRNA-associated Sm-like protein LSm1 [Capsicum annuum]|uniref:U6 snRNA-associated Sm-like protein LSm1 n=1 Tax=Capsicum annuum TaxID=4072 RepID=A0A2G2ZB97_CAPAN|nr:U6 snRNA-associated Sm-like protein LSm1 [Capsicum annuum]